jgi:hypothetical protein
MFGGSSGVEMMVNAIIKSLGFSTDEVKAFANEGMGAFKKFADQQNTIAADVAWIRNKLSGSVLQDDPYLQLLPPSKEENANG